MGGGLIQLVAYGIPDIYLTGDPQITFFKVAYKRHTNFSIEPIKQYFSSSPDFGKKVSCILTKAGDLISKSYLYIELPFIPPFKQSDNQTLDNLKKIAWVRKLGFALINKISIEIGGQLIDCHYGDWLNIWSELTNTHDKSLNEMIGNLPELTSLTNGKMSHKLYIPLEFWFCQDSGLALPIVALQYSEVSIHLELNRAEDCYYIGPTHCIIVSEDVVNFNKNEIIQQKFNNIEINCIFMDYDVMTNKMYYIKINMAQSFNTEPLYSDPDTDELITYPIVGLDSKFTVHPIGLEVKQNNILNRQLTIVKSYLQVDYIYLDTLERVKFIKANHEYLIEQVQFAGTKTISNNNVLQQLSFSNPIKELIWNTSLNYITIDQFNYTNNFINGSNMLSTATLFLNGHPRFSIRDGNYFNWVQAYQYHTRTVDGIYIYSFCLQPEKVGQPDGSINMSKIDDIKLQLVFDGTVSADITAKLRIYGRGYNILRIIHGLGGLAFSN